MPAECGDQCHHCHLEELADKRIQINGAALSSETTAEHFAAFGKWLKDTRGSDRSAQKIHRFLPFFLELERQWGIPDRRKSDRETSSRGTAVKPHVAADAHPSQPESSVRDQLAGVRLDREPRVSIGIGNPFTDLDSSSCVHIASIAA